MPVLKTEYTSIDDLLRRKYGITNIDKAYLAIDYSHKTEFVDKYGRTIDKSRPYSQLQRFTESVLTEEIP